MATQEPRKLGGGSIELRKDKKYWPQWLRECNTEAMEAEVIDGRAIIWGGTIHDGLVHDCDILGGLIREAIVWNCNMMAGRIMNADWRGDYIGQLVVWADGVHRAGEFHGLWLGGLWLGGKWDGWFEKTGRCPGTKLG